MELVKQDIARAVRQINPATGHAYFFFHIGIERKREQRGGHIFPICADLYSSMCVGRQDELKLACG